MRRTTTQRFPSWALWLIGAVTLLGAALLILAAVLGLQAGQRQLDMQLRQQVGIFIQEAVDARTDGQRERALEAYKRAVQLDPTNTIARDGIEQLLGEIKAAGTNGAAAIAPTAPVTAPVAAVATATLAPTAPPATNAVTMLQAAQAAYSAGRWPEAIKQLLTLQQLTPTYEPQQVTDLLFEAYVNLAENKDNEDNLEEALNLFDLALALRSNSTIQRERDIISRYLDATNTYGEAAIPKLQELYDLEPDYRDVAQRLQESLTTYGDALVAQGQWCDAVQQFTAATELAITPGLIAKRDENQKRCDDKVVLTQTTTTPLASRPGETPVGTPSPTELPAPASDFEGRGSLLYSVRDVASGQTHVYLYTIGSGAPPRLLREQAAQAIFRPDGQRLLFRNLRPDSLGLGIWDPATGLAVNFTQFSEDSQPSWSPQGNKIVFASNREGDRLWRVYVKWADENPDVVNLGMGETPDWHPALDQIAFKGCDTTGNNCGLWSMNSTGGQRAPLTAIQRDTHPRWAPDGSSLVFMSDGRDGNMEIYLLAIGSDQPVRLTNNPALDLLPTISPDGQWVAFLSNRDGGWKFWSVPIDSGAAAIVAPLNGDPGNWQEQGLVWMR